MVSVKNLSVSFFNKRIIDDISFNIKAGETLVVLGRNGSGKTVLLKSVAGLVNIDSGEIRINDRDVKDFYRNERTGLERLNDAFRISYVFQKGGLFDSINIFDNTAFGLRRLGYPEEEVHERVSSALERVGLKGTEDKYPSGVSGGMQKRAGLARAVCMKPGLILFDDPTAGLDPILSDSISDLMLEIKESLKTTSIVVTNDLMVAKKTADKVALLYSGRFVCYTDSEDFFSMNNDYSKQFIQGEIEGPIDIL